MTDIAPVVTVGLLYPGHSAEDDFAWLEEHLGGSVALPLVHTSVGQDLHEVGALLDLGSPERLAEGAAQLVSHGPGSVMWACTSGSFVFGWDGARRQVETLTDQTGLPCSSTSLAFVAAARHLGIDRVAVAASYPAPVAEHLIAFLGQGGVSVSAMTSHGIDTAAEVGTLSAAAVIGLARSVDTADAQALLIPDTAMHTLRVIDEMEEAIGLPVLTANQVTVWEGLRVQRALRPLPGLGGLLT